MGEGVKLILHPKTLVKKTKSRIVHKKTEATFNVMQPMVDQNFKLQSLFNDNDPDTIEQKLREGLKEITDSVVEKRRVQTKNRGCLYWNQELERQRKEVEKLST